MTSPQKEDYFLKAAFCMCFPITHLANRKRSLAGSDGCWPKTAPIPLYSDKWQARLWKPNPLKRERKLGIIRVTKLCWRDKISKNSKEQIRHRGQVTIWVNGAGRRIELAWWEVGKERESKHVLLLTTGTLVLTWRPQQSFLRLALIASWKSRLFYYLFKQQCESHMIFVFSVIRLQFDIYC